MRGGVERAGRVGHGLVGDGVAAAVGDQFAADDELGLDGVVGRQHGEHRVIAVHAVHAEVVPAENLRAGGAGGLRREAERISW